MTLKFKSDYYDVNIETSKRVINLIINSYYKYLYENNLKPEISNITPEEFVELPINTIDHILYHALETNSDMQWLLDIIYKSKLGDKYMLHE